MAKIINSLLAYSIKLLPAKILLSEKITLKVEIPVFEGFVLRSDISSQAGTLSTINHTPAKKKKKKT